MTQKWMTYLSALRIFSGFLLALGFTATVAALVEAVKDVAGVDCLTVDSMASMKVAGPQGKNAVTQTAACFDPLAFNPSQLGQLIVTYYGSGDKADAAVEAVIAVDFEVFK